MKKIIEWLVRWLIDTFLRDKFHLHENPKRKSIGPCTCPECVEAYGFKSPLPEFTESKLDPVIDPKSGAYQDV